MTWPLRAFMHKRQLFRVFYAMVRHLKNDYL